MDILFVNACARENSRTLALAKEVLLTLGGEVQEVRLYETRLAPLDAEGLRKRETASSAKDFSDDEFALAVQFASAKTIVIAAPYWDLMFPSVLKTYFEAVTVSGLVFNYNENGIPTGLCRAKRMIYVTTSGGPIIKNFGFDYACALAQSFYGISDVRCVSAEGLDIRGADADAIMFSAKETVKRILTDEQ